MCEHFSPTSRTAASWLASDRPRRRSPARLRRPVWLVSRSLTIPPVSEWGWIVVAAGTAVAIELGLRTLTLPRLSRLAGASLRTGGPTQTMASERIGIQTGALTVSERRRLRAARRVTRHWPFGDTCLRQALVSGAMIRRRHPDLVVGVAKLDGEIRAHAWLEFDGRVLDPLAAAAAYTPLSSVEPR